MISCLSVCAFPPADDGDTPYMISCLSVCAFPPADDGVTLDMISCLSVCLCFPTYHADDGVTPDMISSLSVCSFPPADDGVTPDMISCLSVCVFFPTTAFSMGPYIAQLQFLLCILCFRLLLTFWLQGIRNNFSFSSSSAFSFLS